MSSVKLNNKKQLQNGNIDKKNRRILESSCAGKIHLTIQNKLDSNSMPLQDTCVDN